MNRKYQYWHSIKKEHEGGGGEPDDFHPQALKTYLNSNFFVTFPKKMGEAELKITFKLTSHKGKNIN